MTQEEKELLLKDLCARLPYGVKVNVNGEIQTFDSLCDDDGYRFQFLQSVGITEGVNIENIKPYLRPMSSMTDEEYKEWRYLYLPIPHKNEATETERRIDWLNKYHFDYRGLIEMGLAIEAPEGIYKIN